jgi:2,5-dioxopentanoate dehydrogenase
MKPLLLLLLIVTSAAATGVMLAGMHGYGPLSYISYNVIQTNNNSNNNSIEIIPAYINLGNITAGETGTVSANATLVISSNGTYEIELLHTEKLSKVFSSFNVTINIGNTTLTLTLHHDDQELNLTAGKYNVIITIHYKVADNPHGDLRVNNEPLLLIHPHGDHDHGHDHSQGNSPSTDNSPDTFTEDS